MKSLRLALVGLALTSPALADSTGRAIHMDAYLSIWSSNGAITPAVVGRLYGQRVDYYGHVLSADGVYRDKLAFVRRWPMRRYAAVPGTVANDCSAAKPSCRVSAVMRWSRADRAGHRESGTNSVRLVLAREGGMLKIVQESGSPVADTGSRGAAVTGPVQVLSPPTARSSP